MTPELFSSIVGIVISILAFFVPAYNSLPGDRKRLIMAGAAILVGGGVFIMACLPVSFPLPWRPTYTCDMDGGSAVLLLAISNLGGSQAAYYAGRVLSWARPVLAGWLARRNGGDSPQ